jgi:steroid delta-isomerase-like uncharacterized protein
MTDAPADVVARYIAALNEHDPDAVVRCVTSDFHNEHTSALGHSLRGRDAYRARLPTFLGGFTDLHYDVEDVVVQDERVVVAYRMTFRYRCADGELRPVVIRGVFRFRVADGLIAHRADYWDGADFQRQVGDGA